MSPDLKLGDKAVLRGELTALLGNTDYAVLMTPRGGYMARLKDIKPDPTPILELLLRAGEFVGDSEREFTGVGIPRTYCNWCLRSKKEGHAPSQEGPHGVNPCPVAMAKAWLEGR